MKKQRLRRLPIAFTAKRDARRGKHMNTGFARSKRCVEKLRPPIPKVHQRKVRPRLHGPRILRSKSKFPENSLRPSAQRGARCRSGSCLQTAGSERVENAIFWLRSVLVEKRWRFVSLGGHCGAVGFSVIPERQRKRRAACVFIHLKVVAAKIRIHRHFHAAH